MSRSCRPGSRSPAAARQFGSGVGKSGSPTSMWMMSRPSASSWRAGQQFDDVEGGDVPGGGGGTSWLVPQKKRPPAGGRSILSLRRGSGSILEDAISNSSRLSTKFARHLFAHLVEPLLWPASSDFQASWHRCWSGHELGLVSSGRSSRCPRTSASAQTPVSLAATVPLQRDDPLQDAHVVAEARPGMKPPFSFMRNQLTRRSAAGIDDVCPSSASG